MQQDGAALPGRRNSQSVDCRRAVARVHYDLERARTELTKERIEAGPRSMWRYAPLLPLRDLRNVVSLGEGWTPLPAAPRLGAAIGCPNLAIKDEGANPTGTFKARGMAAAVSLGNELGISKFAAPSAGNAASALAAYAARAGLEAHIFMPRDAPRANYIECKMFGAHVTLVDGLISDCGRIVAERKDAEGWFDVSTLKEPYRIEGKKTMGLELAEQLGWRLPDAVFYPTGGGVGIIGMWKAFDELERLGWISSKRPKMIAVQAAGCAPIVKAYEEGANRRSSGRMPQPSRADCGCPRRWAIFSCSRPCARAAEPPSRSATGSCSKPDGFSPRPRVSSPRPRPRPA